MLCHDFSYQTEENDFVMNVDMVTKPVQLLLNDFKPILRSEDRQLCLIRQWKPSHSSESEKIIR